jgi:hypothetical protein
VRGRSARARPLLPAGVVLAAIGALAVLLIARNAAKVPSANLVYQGPRTYRDTAAPTKANSPYTFGSLVLCLEGAGPLAITDIRPEKTVGDLRVDAWGGRSNPIMPGDTIIIDGPGDLRNLGFQVGNGQVQATCSDSPDSGSQGPTTELAVQVSKPTTRDAWLEGPIVLYKGREGNPHTLHIPWVLGLCESTPGGSSSDKVC